MADTEEAISNGQIDEIAAPDGNGELDEPKEAAGGRKRPRIEKFFRTLVKLQASDLHLKANSKPRVRVGGAIKALHGDKLSNEAIESMTQEIMNDEHKRLMKEYGAADFAYQLGDSDRFRVNVFRARGNVSLVARRVSKKIFNFDELHLPPSIYKITEYHQGLVLLAGITGSGKSTTIAAALDYINAHRACHIVTIEDPIEYLYTDKKAFINQREIGIDVRNFPDGLKYLMRQDPDVVLVGEMRDAETFMAALNAAETGHLVFGTVHASGAAQTVTRLLDLLPEGSRDLVRQTLVFNLQAVICQKLLKSIKPGVPRVPAVEIMYSNPSIRKLIDEQREEQLIDVIRVSGAEGMLDMNECLKGLVEDEYITIQTAYQESPNPDELRMRLKGISNSGGSILG